MRWLVVSPYLPHPGIGHGGGTAVLQLCRALAARHETTLLCFRREDEAGLEADLIEHGVRVETVGLRSDRARGLPRVGLIADRAACALRAATKARPLMAEKYDRSAMHARLEALIAEIRPDAVQVEYSFMSTYARTARFGVDGVRTLWHKGPDPAEGDRPHVLLNTHEIGTLPRIRRLRRAGGRWSSWRASRELAIWAVHDHALVDAADTVLCVTEQDRRLLRSLSGTGDPVTVALGAEVAEVPLTHRPTPDPTPSLLFVGGFAHPPNVEGALWLCDEVMPRVWARSSGIRVEIVGRAAPDALRRRAEGSGGRIRISGFVDDLGEVFERNDVFVAPLVSGGGIKIKVLEAMGRGAAVVTTSIGAEGIDESGRACALADSAEDFAERILQLVDEPAERQRLGAAAHAWIRERFGWDAIVRDLTAIVEGSRRN